MQYVKLGKSDLNVSKICLGCMSFGEKTKNLPWTLDQEQTDIIIKKALDLGINFFDTANIYGNGTSEIFIGNSFKKFVKDRKDIIVATKVRWNEGALSKEAIMREIDGSLKRLQMDYIDLYIIHRWDYEHPIEETMEALNELVKAKKVRYLGCSSIFPYQLLKANMIAREHGWAEFISIQNHYNLIYREDEREMIQLLEEEQMVMTPYSAMGAGRLCRLPTDEQTLRFKDDPNAVFKYAESKDIDAPVIKRVKEVADKMKISMALVALAWIYSKPLVASPVLGFTKVSQLEEAFKVFSIKLDPEDVKYLEELYVPHPYKGPMLKP
jgi:aryl-alcohol dehydrogenase-like predicted oxidoreductase